MSGPEGPRTRLTGGPSPGSARARVDEDGSREMMRRRVPAAVIGVAALAGLALGGCAQSNTPTDYNTLTRQNFLETCTNRYFDNTDNTIAITDNTVQSDVSEAPDENTCECQYEVFTGPLGTDDTPTGEPPVPINSGKAPEGYTGINFTSLNSDLKSDPEGAWNKVPQDLKDQISACGSSSSSSGSSTTSTTASGESTTTTAG